MASNLLDTLKKIDDGRKNMITNVRNSLSTPISDDASFAELAQYIGLPMDNFDNVIKDMSPRIPLWERPSEWPDCYSIVRNAEAVNGKRPIYIALLNTNADTTYFPAPTSNYYGNNTPEPVNYANTCNRLVLSDGTVYDNVTAAITHTWDKTKDVVIPDGEFAGTYRWFMVYEGSSTTKYITLAGMPVAEVLIHSKPSTSYQYCHWIAGYSADAACSTLLNFEVLPEYPATSIGHGSLGMYQETFYYCTKLRRFALGPVTTFSPSGTSHSCFKGWDNITVIDCPNITHNFLADILPNADSLQYLVCKTTGTLSLGAMYHLKTLKVPKAYIAFTAVDGIPGHLRSDCDLEFLGFSANVPYYWTSNHGYRAYASGNTWGGNGHPNLRVYNYTGIAPATSTNVTSEGSTACYFKNCFSLREIIVTDGWMCRMNLKECKLNPSNLTDIINKLADLTVMEATIYTPKLWLSEYNKQLLTETDIQTATSKGWVLS